MADVGGIYHWGTDLPLSQESAQAMAAALSFRGRYKSAIWSDNKCALVHAGKNYLPQDVFEIQPYHELLSKRVLVADLRLDNREDLCDQFYINLSRRAVTPDSQLVLKAYDKWKQRCVEYLQGDFSFAIWDEREETLFCARDQRATIPFFYTTCMHGVFAFSSSVRALLSLPGMIRELNLQTLADRLSYNSIADNTQSYYKEVRQLPAAHALLVSPKGVRSRRYWEYQPKVLSYAKEEDYIEAFSEHLNQAVRSRIRSRRAIGAHMSGGLDSTSVASIAANMFRFQNRRLITFTQVPQSGFTLRAKSGDSYDDRDLVAAVVERHENIDAKFCSLEGLSASKNLNEFFEFSDIPPLNTFNRLWIERIHIHAQQLGLGVLLCGDTGNLTISLSVIGHYLQSLLNNRNWTLLWRELRSTSQVKNDTVWRIVLSQLLKPYILSSLSRMKPQRKQSEYNKLREFSFVRENFARQMNVSQRLAMTGRIHMRMPPIDIAEKIRRKMLLEPVAQRSLFQHAYHRMFDVRTLDPTNDIRLIEFCLNLPRSSYFYKGWDRALVRRAMTQLPDQVRWNQTRGKQAADWMMCMDKSLSEIADDLESMRDSPLASHILDLKSMRTTLAQWQGGEHVYKNSEAIYRVKLMRAWLLGRFVLWEENQTNKVNPSNYHHPGNERSQ